MQNNKTIDKTLISMPSHAYITSSSFVCGVIIHGLSVLLCIHIRDTFEQLHLTETHFALHPLLNSYIHACVIDDMCVQTTFSPSVPDSLLHGLLA